MSNSQSPREEEIYLGIYDVISDNADYFQPGGDVKRFLPEAVLIGILASVITAFLEDIVRRLAKGLITYFEKRTKKFKQMEVTQEEVLSVMREVFARVPVTQNDVEASKDAVVQALEATPQLTEARRRAIAEAVIEVISRSLRPND